MKSLKSVKLVFISGSSDKEYRIHLLELDGLFWVNYQNGRRGGTLTSGAKTKEGVAESKAEEIFEKL